MAESLDLTGNGLDPLVQVTLVLVKTKDQLGRARRYLVLAVIQCDEERPARGTCAGPDGDALLDRESADLVDRRGPTGHEP